MGEKENRKASEELQRLKMDFAAAEERHRSLRGQVAGEQRHELFQRPLLENRSPSGATGGNTKTFAEGSNCDGASVHRSGFREASGELSNKRMPSFTPGFFGTGRFTKRRIT